MENFLYTISVFPFSSDFSFHLRKKLRSLIKIQDQQITTDIFDRKNEYGPRAARFSEKGFYEMDFREILSNRESSNAWLDLENDEFRLFEGGTRRIVIIIFLFFRFLFALHFGFV